MSKGKFVTLEGGEGVGKTTNLAFIREFLECRGIPALFTREPGGTDLGERIRELLLGGDNLVCAEAELLLMFAARAQHLNQVINPALESGSWVICDRFTDASFAYQGGGRGMGADFIATLEDQVQGAVRPDLTLLLDAPVSVGMLRAKQRGSVDRFEAESLAFFERVRSAYLQRAKLEPERIRIVDATQSLPEVQKAIARCLEALTHASS